MIPALGLKRAAFFSNLIAEARTLLCGAASQARRSGCGGLTARLVGGA